jgi:hypothetical protein
MEEETVCWGKYEDTKERKREYERRWRVLASNNDEIESDVLREIFWAKGSGVESKWCVDENIWS